ncbi:MAG: hypothetical protein ACK6DT_09290, partial [Planctomycetota bacterium]
MASNRRRAVLTVVLVATVALFAGEAWVQHRTDAAWQRVAAERDGLAVQLAARPTQRAPLLGAPTPGLAFDHYAGATAAAAPLDRDRNAEARKLLTADDAAVAAAPLRAAWEPVVAGLRRGAPAGDARAPHQGPMPQSG